MTGALPRVKIQGTVLSILFARAISIAPALNGLGNSNDGAGECGVTGVVPFCPARPPAGSSAGVIKGDEKQRR
jgi:hypothetical protein